MDTTALPLLFASALVSLAFNPAVLLPLTILPPSQGYDSVTMDTTALSLFFATALLSLE